MDLKTKDIINAVEIQSNKTLEATNKEDLLNIKKLTLNRLDYNGKIQEIEYNELLYLENLEELNIFNYMIDEKMMNAITNMKNIKRLNIYDSDFIDYIDDMFLKINLEELTIRNCIGLSIKKLENIKYIEIANTEIEFSINNVETLNLYNNDINVNLLNHRDIKNIIISEKDYNNEIDLKKLNANLTILNDKREIIKEIKNDQV